MNGGVAGQTAATLGTGGRSAATAAVRPGGCDGFQ